MISIRRSRRSEVRLLLTIWRRAVDATHGFLRSRDRRAIDAELQQLLGEVRVWVAADEMDRALGFMLLSQGHIEALFIDPAVHRQGIGRLLVEYALGLSGSLTTDVNEQNRQAIQFYERLGFVLVGRSAEDCQGRPYPLLHMQMKQAQDPSGDFLAHSSN